MRWALLRTVGSWLPLSLWAVAWGCAEGAPERSYRSGSAGSDAGGEASGTGGADAGAAGTGGASANPCEGVACHQPPAATCRDASYLTVFEAPGSCANGVCSYPSHDAYCQFGCEKGICNDDPCLGISCSTPPASYCSGPNSLVVYEPNGTCAKGACSYGSHEEQCAHGCDADQCAGDPCVGVQCTLPPSSYCLEANTLRAFDAAGSCSEGDCDYPFEDTTCPHGCDAGVCLDCTQDGDCGPGRWCNGSSCADCTTDEHCGTSCDNCSATNQVCNAGIGCVACTSTGHCGSGHWCDGTTCRPCDTSEHCGPSCLSCPSEAPACDGTSCTCTAASCPANERCVGGACAFCAVDSACGAQCEACGPSHPKCLDEAASSRCVQCLTEADCAQDEHCVDHVCSSSTCSLPSESCNTGGQNRSGCANARVIGRLEASSSAGYFVGASTCGASAASEGPSSSSCWDYGRDHSYRIFLRSGETIAVTVTKGSKCSGATSWDRVFKVYEGAGCEDKSCASKLVCKSMGNLTFNDWFTAPSDAWYVVVIDGRSATGVYDDSGDYTLTVKLTCSTTGCGC